MNTRDETDPLAPQREAAFFYGLFLRGHSLDALRQDIDISPKVREKWRKARDFQAGFLSDLERIYAFRKQVLVVFEALVHTEIINSRQRARLQ